MPEVCTNAADSWCKRTILEGGVGTETGDGDNGGNWENGLQNLSGITPETFCGKNINGKISTAVYQIYWKNIK